jgi:hypothetical protein
MSVPVSNKKSRKPNLDVEDGIEYPSSDGKPMGETGTHARVAMVSIYGVLYHYDPSRLRREIEDLRRRLPEGE